MTDEQPPKRPRRDKSVSQQRNFDVSDDSRDLLTNGSRAGGTVYTVHDAPKGHTKIINDRGSILKVARDIYCFKCHKLALEDWSLDCKKCVRTYHKNCTDVTDEDSQIFICDACQYIEQPVDTRPKLSKEHLNELLRKFIERIKEITNSRLLFRPISATAYPYYYERVFHPFDMGTIEKRLSTNYYNNTRHFESDCAWIAHNMKICCPSKEHKTVLSTMASAWTQTCFEYRRCVECAEKFQSGRPGYFAELCERPHMLVWVRLQNYPWWPAKAMSITKNGIVNCVFFGEHDVADVSCENCFLLSSSPPSPVKNGKKAPTMRVVFAELENYIENLKKRYGKFHYAMCPDNVRPDQIDNVSAFMKIYIDDEADEEIEKNSGNIDVSTKIAYSNENHHSTDSRTKADMDIKRHVRKTAHDEPKVDDLLDRLSAAFGDEENEGGEINNTNDNHPLNFDDTSQTLSQQGSLEEPNCIQSLGGDFEDLPVGSSATSSPEPPPAAQEKALRQRDKSKAASAHQNTIDTKQEDYSISLLNSNSQSCILKNKEAFANQAKPISGKDLIPASAEISSTSLTPAEDADNRVDLIERQKQRAIFSISTLFDQMKSYSLDFADFRFKSGANTNHLGTDDIRIRLEQLFSLHRNSLIDIIAFSKQHQEARCNMLNMANIEVEKLERQKNEEIESALLRQRQRLADSVIDVDGESRRCAYCHKMKEGDTVLLCCEAVHYCNRECQVRHWKTHMPTCTNPRLQRRT